MLASLSCDLDDKWSYMKTHGDRGWEMYPSYLRVVVPRILQVLKQFNLRITFFIVGQDAALARNDEVMRGVAESGHEVGNHSFRHEPWFHLYSPEEIRSEIEMAESHIEKATGQRPVGFRGPGYSLSEGTVAELTRRGYLYDATTFPSLLTPLVRRYYFTTANFSGEEKRRRKDLGGKIRDGLRPNRAYYWQVDGRHLFEIPVTTLPMLKVPMHMSYLMGLMQWSPTLAMTHLELGLRLCQMTKVEPSIVLHPTDFLGVEDGEGLTFIPGMQLSVKAKLNFVCRVLERLRERFSVSTLRDYAIVAAQRSGVPVFSPSLEQRVVLKKLRPS